MNLFQNPSLDELQKLMSKRDPSLPVHNIVVDYDGEVLIDPQLKHPGIDLNKFKFRVRLTNFQKEYISRRSEWMKSLMKNLLYGWQGRRNNPLMTFPIQLKNT